MDEQTPQQIFESSLQNTHDTFQAMKKHLNEALDEIPLQDILQYITENESDPNSTIEYVEEWMKVNYLPELEASLHLTQQQILDTTAAWIAAMGTE